MKEPIQRSSLKTFQESAPSFLTSELKKFDLGEDITASVSSYVEKIRHTIYEQMETGVSAERQVQLQSLMFDVLITNLYQYAFESTLSQGVLKTPVALLALGGYGRAELNLYSDIDLLFLYEGNPNHTLEPVTQKMLYPLWDAKVEVGYATRSLSDCQKVMQEDIRAMSSMLDARFLSGDRALAGKFNRFLESKISSSRTLKDFVEKKNQETQERLNRFGGSVYVIEPNLKESEGGLRDWHTLRYFAKLALKTSVVEEWVRRAFISNEEAESLRRALNFFWEVRNRLHRRAGRCADQLMLEFQEPISKAMGFSNDRGCLGVEKFMQAYYGHAADLLRLRKEVSRRVLKPPRSFWRRLRSRRRSTLTENLVVCGGKILPRSLESIEAHPQEILKAFFLAQKKRHKVDPEFKSWISRHLHLIDEKFRSDPKVGAMLREMFGDIRGIGDSLWEMYDCRLLGVLIPEFGDILFQTQHDSYHVYTVDTHSLFAVQGLSRLYNGEYDQEFPLLKKALLEVQAKSTLVLGVLFHDIGKGKGGRHSEVGAKLAKTIMKRMGYSEEEQRAVEFLVLSHLMMPYLSQRRDLEDLNMIQHFGRTLEELERLNQLFVLTWADIRAVGPEVWTPWKGDLLRELYLKTREYLEKGDWSPERASVRTQQICNEVLKIYGKNPHLDQLKNYLDSMPPRYFFAYDASQILKHFQWMQDQSSKEILMLHAEPDVKRLYHDLYIYTVNTNHLFQQITGVMAVNQVNILALEQFFDNKGEALVALKVTGYQGEIIRDLQKFKKIKEDLKKVLSGQIYLDRYAQNRPSSPWVQPKSKVPKPPQVDIDNMVSPYYTVIDIYADDRIGLLYDVACAMQKLNLFVEVSKISTKVDQVADAFYVKDIFGDKITEQKKIKMIKNDLLAVLSEEITEEVKNLAQP